MFLTFKPKGFFIFLLVCVLSFGITFGFYKSVKANSAPKFNYTIVVKK